MSPAHTEADFDRLCWHDCPLRGLAFHVGDPDEGDWTSDLVLDLDFIVEWLCDTDGRCRFRLAPATLVFHGVTDLHIHLDPGTTGFQVALFERTIDRIERAPVPDQKVFLDRPYHAWRIVLHGPGSGEITFGAVGFTQRLRAAPVVKDQQRLSLRERGRFPECPSDLPGEGP